MKNIYFLPLILFFNLFSATHEERFAKAYEYVNNGEYDDALSIYQDLNNQFPQNIELLNNLGFVLKKQNKMTEAIAIYEKARNLSSTKNSRIERALSHAYLSLGDFEHGWPAYEYRWVNPPFYN